MKEISINMTSKTVKAKTRKLRAMCTTEMVKDISSYHSMDVTKELEDLKDYYKKEAREKKLKDLLDE